MRHVILLVGLGLCAAVTFTLPPIPQPLAYHSMADDRVMLGIPNCLNVLSNVPFALVGVMGLVVVFSHRADGTIPFRDEWERWPYAALFVGMGLTSIGSSYYHLAPDNARLVWDRLPMAIGFMGLLTAVLAERIGIRGGRWAFGPLLLLGAGSVVYWRWTELRGAGDLRFYGLVQFGSLLIIALLLLLYPGRYRNTGYLSAGIGAYVAAKIFELADHRVFALGQVVSGHTLKHLAAAGGAAMLVIMLEARALGAERSEHARKS